MTTRKRGFYYYLVWFFSIIGVPLTLIAGHTLYAQWLDGTLFTNYGISLRSVLSIMIEMYWISQVFEYGAGYTVITTQKYNLFKCKESGVEEPFMMFADNEEELEKFFEYTKPDKKIFIEPAEMTGKSIQMKIFNNIENE
jgi:hypothetical protein